MRKLATPILTVLVAVAAGIVWWGAWRRDPPPTPAAQAPRPAAEPQIPYEEWARREFLRNHPGEKPLNWAIAETAREYRESKPMGPFVLGSNDCSDFTDSILDDALGLRARFRRESPYHLVSVDTRPWDIFAAEPGDELLPGDEINVLHSPHYPPRAETIGHCGVLGPDGMVYDWTRLRSWGADQYGRHTVEWFTANARGPGEITVRRLRPEFRYMIEEIPHISEAAAASVQ